MFKGSIVAIVTPMLENGAIDAASFTGLLDFHLKHHTDGIVVLGTTGESPTVNATERKKLIEQAVKHIAGRVPVIVGTGANSTEQTIELTRQAMELGADAALLVTPYYNKPTQEGLYQHFKCVAEAVPIPQILYNVPGRTGVDLLPDTAIRLSKVPNIVALKEATGKLERAKELIKEGSIDLLCGSDEINGEFLLAGGVGIISVVANIVPQPLHQLCEVAAKKNREDVEALELTLKPLYELLFVESNPIPVKWALKEMGLIKAGIRLPLTPLADQHRDAVRKAVQALTQKGSGVCGI